MEECQKRKELVRAYHDACAGVIGVRGTSNGRPDKSAREVSDRAQRVCDEAFAALEKHISEHGCASASEV